MEGPNFFFLKLIKSLRKHPKFSRDEKVRIDVLDKFGFFSTESNGHLSEYLPWYRRTQKDVKKWSSLSNWIHGETGGYLRVCNEKRNWFVEDFPKYLKKSGHTLLLHGRYTCKARAPSCKTCVIIKYCKYNKKELR